MSDLPTKLNATTMREAVLLSDIAMLQGTLQGVMSWQHEPIMRRTLLETLLLLDGFNPEQVGKILYDTERKGIGEYVVKNGCMTKICHIKKDEESKS